MYSSFQMTIILIILSFIVFLTSSAQTQAAQEEKPTNSYQQKNEFMKLGERIWFLTNNFDEFKNFSMKQEQLIKELFFQLNRTNEELNGIKSLKEKQQNQIQNQQKQTNDELKETKNQLKETNDKLMQTINQLNRMDVELNQQKQTIEKLKLPKDQQTQTEAELNQIKTQLKLLNESRNCQCQFPTIEIRTPILNNSKHSENNNCTQIMPNDLMCLNGGSPVFESNSSCKLKNDCACAPRFRGHRCQLNCTFKAEAGVDLPGVQFDISFHPEPDVNRCLDKCAATPNCLSVMHNGGNTNCILKSKNSTTTEKSHFIATRKENVLYTITCN